VVRPVPLWIEHPSTVVITQTRRHTSLTQLCESLEHVAQSLVKLPRHRYPIDGGQQAGVQEEIQSIDVVVEGLLEVQPVWADLTFGFTANDPPAQALPTLRRTELRAQRSYEK
jgi:hypothetical protein